MTVKIDEDKGKKTVSITITPNYTFYKAIEDGLLGKEIFVEDEIKSAIYRLFMTHVPKRDRDFLIRLFPEIGDMVPQ